MIELRRQIFHVAVGLAFVVLIYFGYVGALEILALLVAGVIVSFLSKSHRIPVIEWFLQRFDRTESKIRGYGVLTYLLGALLAVAIFPKSIALAALMVLALGDSFCHLGRLGKIRHPFNRTKMIEGVVAGIIAGSLGALLFVPILPAFLGAAVAMIAESFDLKIGGIRLDDNVLIPLVAGTVMSLLLLL